MGSMKINNKALIGGYIKLSGIEGEILKIYVGPNLVYEKQQPPVGNYTAYADTVSGCTVSPSLPASLTAGASATFTITPTVISGGYTIFSYQKVGTTSGGTDIINYDFSHGGVDTFTVSSVASDLYISSVFETGTMRVTGELTQAGTVGQTVDSTAYDLITLYRARSTNVRSWSDLVGHRVVLKLGVSLTSSIYYEDATVDLTVNSRFEQSQVVISSGTGSRAQSLAIVYAARGAGVILRVTTGAALLRAPTAHVLVQSIIVY